MICISNVWNSGLSNLFIVCKCNYGNMMVAVWIVSLLVYIYMLVVKMINSSSNDEPASAGIASAYWTYICQLTPQSILSDIYALCTVTSPLKKSSQNQYKFGNFMQLHTQLVVIRLNLHYWLTNDNRKNNISFLSQSL